MTRRNLIAIGMMATVMLAGCGKNPSPVKEQKPAVVDATVTVELRWPLIDETLDSHASAPEQCAGALDYSKVATGAVVTFRDADATIVGTTKLLPPGESDNLVICKWTAETELASGSKFFTAEVGGWKSSAARSTGGEVDFLLDTVKEHPEFGSKAEVDSAWSRIE